MMGSRMRWMGGEDVSGSHLISCRPLDPVLDLHFISTPPGNSRHISGGQPVLGILMCAAVWTRPGSIPAQEAGVPRYQD